MARTMVDEALALRHQTRADTSYGIARVVDQPHYKRVRWQAVGAVFAWHARKAMGLESGDCPYTDPDAVNQPVKDLMVLARKAGAEVPEEPGQWVKFHSHEQLQRFAAAIASMNSPPEQETV